MFQRQPPSKSIHKLTATSQALMTTWWASDAATIRSAVARFSDTGTLTTGCTVALFEIDGDRQLHVNVTHQHLTKSARGWSGPATLPNGFVHNRRFANGRPEVIIAHIRKMVFAPRA